MGYINYPNIYFQYFSITTKKKQILIKHVVGVGLIEV